MRDLVTDPFHLLAAARTPPWSVLCFAVAAAIGAVGQLLYKTGADAAGRSVADGTSPVLAYLNWKLLLGVLCYIAVMALFVAAFRIGGSLAVLYPVYASTFIWAALLGWWIYGRPVSLVNGLGMALLVGGMWLMGRGGSAEAGQ